MQRDDLNREILRELLVQRQQNFQTVKTERFDQRSNSRTKYARLVPQLEVDAVPDSNEKSKEPLSDSRSGSKSRPHTRSRRAINL